MLKNKIQLKGHHSLENHPKNSYFRILDALYLRCFQEPHNSFMGLRKALFPAPQFSGQKHSSRFLQTAWYQLKRPKEKKTMKKWRAETI